MELQEQIQQVKQWEWYITQKPKWLAEKLDEKFNMDVNTTKLQSIRRKMEKEGTLDY